MSSFPRMLVCSLAVALAVPGFSADFDCIELPANPQTTPADCANPNHPFFDPAWCNCLTTSLTFTKEGEFTEIEQALIDVWHQPTVGKHVMTANHGTLDISKIAVGNQIGQFIVDVLGAPLGLPENFYLDIQMEATEVTSDTVKFDMYVRETNPTSIAVLNYDPMDTAHAGGLTYTGQVVSFGALSGFELTYEYLPFDRLPADAIHTGIEFSDLASPGFTVPFKLIFPVGQLFKLEPAGPLEISTVLDQFATDPGNPVQKAFSSIFDIKPAGDLPPAAPAGLSATAGNREVQLQWSDNTDADLASYNVYRGTAAGGPYTKAGNSAISEYLDTDVQNETTYFYVVRAVDKTNNESAASGEVSATPKSPIVAKTFRRGDSDANNSIELTDAVSLLNYLFTGGVKPACLDAADFDDNGEPDISDAIANLNYQFLGGTPPAAPGPTNCGPDPKIEDPDIGCDTPCA